MGGACSREGASGEGNAGGGGGMGRIALVAGSGGYDDTGGITSPLASVTSE